MRLGGRNREASAKKTFKEMRALESPAGTAGDDDGEWKRFREKWNSEPNVKEDVASAGPEDGAAEEKRRSAFGEGVSVRFSSGEKGRHVIATRAIEPGDRLIEEGAFAHILIPDHNSLHCQRCLKAKLNLIPCSGCSEAAYCGRECRDYAFRAYHARECRYMTLLTSMGIAHLGHRIVNQVGVVQVLKTHRAFVDDGERGSGNLVEVSDDVSDYESVYGLLTHENETAPEDLFQYALTAVLMLKMICDVDETLRKAYASILVSPNVNDVPAKLLTIGEVLLRHIQQLICNASAITAVVDSSHSRSTTTTTEDQVRIATAIFPRLSLLNHSCDPNIIVSYVGTTVTAKATRRIPAGDEVFNCYGPHHLRMTVGERREALRQQYHFHCRCMRCEGGDAEDDFKAGKKPFVSNDKDECKDKDKSDKSTKSTTTALKCRKCDGPMISTPDQSGVELRCLGCAFSPGQEQSRDLMKMMKKLSGMKDAVKERAGEFL